MNSRPVRPTVRMERMKMTVRIKRGTLEEVTGKRQLITQGIARCGDEHLQSEASVSRAQGQSTLRETLSQK